MSSASEFHPISVKAYLDGELTAKRKHEYVDGVVYAMAGGTNTHNRIATNGTVSLGGQLRGKICQVFNSDTKVRIRPLRGTRFYYPDFLVACRLNSANDHFQDDPKIVAEVISESTRRTDEFEKREAYFSISSIYVYLLVEQSSAAVLVYRRLDSGFVREHYEGNDAVIPLPEIDCVLPLAELYENVIFTPLVDEDEL